MANLDDAIALAVRAHVGARDKGGEPYILHPLRVMLAMQTDDDRMAAVLHDVVEDSAVTLADLRAAGFPEPVVAAIDSLTRRPAETYEDFIQRVAQNPMAVRVKIEDLADNLDVSRLSEIGPKDRARIERYRRAMERLERVAHDCAVASLTRPTAWARSLATARAVNAEAEAAEPAALPDLRS